jgi:predicted transcriptional regulator
MTRVKQDDVYHYAPTITKAEFTQRASRHVVQRLVTLGSAAVSASLVDVLAERDPEQLAELARLVQERCSSWSGSPES